MKNIQAKAESWLWEKQHEIRAFPQKISRKLVKRVRKNPFLSILGLALIGLVFFNLGLNKKDSSSEQMALAKRAFLNISTRQKVAAPLFFRQDTTGLIELAQPKVLADNTLKEASPIAIVESKSLAMITGLDEPPDSRETKEYLVQPGDTLSQLSQTFGISLETILWANHLQKNSSLKPGQRLIILPVSGVLHLVKKGETASQISKKYKVDLAEVIAFNELPEGGEVFTGDLLIVPGGKVPPESSLATIASNFFIRPVSNSYRITQGLHAYNAVDFANGRCGESIFAAAGGQVQKIGLNKKAGKYITVLHPNGVVTFYGHLSEVLVSLSQSVSQGDILGYIGATGYTIPAGACHLHFDVRGAVNPFAR